MTAALVFKCFLKNLALWPQGVWAANMSLLCRSGGIVAAVTWHPARDGHLAFLSFFSGAGIELVKLVLSPDPPLSPLGIAATAKILPAFCLRTLGPISSLPVGERSRHAPCKRVHMAVRGCLAPGKTLLSPPHFGVQQGSRPMGVQAVSPTGTVFGRAPCEAASHGGNGGGLVWSAAMRRCGLK